jgi:hypothetical protein
MQHLTDAEIIKALRAENEQLEAVARTSWLFLALACFVIVVESLALIFIIIK